MTPPAIAAYREDGIFADGVERVRGWNARCIPNLFPAVSRDPGQVTGEWVAVSGRGGHEIIIESPNHDKSPAGFSKVEMERMLEVYRDRYREHMDAGAAYVSLFKNWGELAGASLRHTHSQLISLPIVPPLLIRERRAIADSPFCPYCHIVEREEASSRLVASNRSWIQIAPFCSQVPYEIWILPRVHASSLIDLDRSRLADLAELLGEALRGLGQLLDDPPYNYMFFQLPGGYHMNLRIQPVTTKMAGFEKNTGIFINPVPPEQAARELADA